jgi:2-dehydro-3-deoxy-D-gluconate 5-dehydrogenase
MDLFDVTGQKAIVTGGGKGLGRAMAEILHEAGAEVALIGSSESSCLAAKELGASGPSAYSIRADLSDRQELRRAFDEAVEMLGDTVDILVNNAGVIRRHKSEEFPIEDWDAQIELNLTATFVLCQMAGRIMLEKGRGRIINVASLLSFFGGLTVPAYAASKAGVGQLTKALSNEWAGRGINVNAIAPGYMNTDLTAALINDPVRSREIISRIPAGRWGLPDDLKGITLFLASSASDYVTGTVIPVDGGYTGR